MLKARITCSAFVLGLTLIALASTTSRPVQAQVIEPSGLWVTDHAQILTESEINSLSAVLATYARETSTQIVVVIIPELQGRDIASYAVELGETWEVGRRGVDNGIVILVSYGDRKVFIATGYGVEASVPDVVAGRIVRDIITPSFRQGRYHEGLREAADALIAATRGVFEAVQRSDRRAFNIAPRIIYFALLLIIVIVAIIVIRRASSDNDHFNGPRRRRRRGFPPIIIWGGGWGGRHTGGSWGGSSSGGFGGGGFGGGGFSGGGGSFGGGGAGGGW